AGNLACESDGGDPFASSLLDFLRPAHHRVVPAASASAPGCLDERPSQGARSGLRQRQTLLSFAARVLARHKTHIRFDLVRRRKSLAFVECRTKADCGYWSYSWHRHQPSADRIVVGNLGELLVCLFDLAVELLDRIELPCHPGRHIRE